MRALAAVLLSLFLAPAFVHGFPEKSELKEFLKGSTWCFQDTAGPRYRGRIRFFPNGSGKYDVVDAPPGGGIWLGWNTLENFLARSIMMEFASGMDPLQQWAVVDVVNQNEMTWRWHAGFECSTLYRCAP